MTIFFDTNILLYSLTTDDPIKCNAALELMNAGGTMSVQVLNEMVSVLRGRKKWEWQKVNVALYSAKALMNVCDVTVESQALAVGFSERYNFAIYDANIIASAILSGCNTLLSEDMQHGQVIEGVRIVNPFVSLI